MSHYKLKYRDAPRSLQEVIRKQLQADTFKRLNFKQQRNLLILAEQEQINPDELAIFKD